MNKLEQAARQALEALEKAERQLGYNNIVPHSCYREAIIALREALDHSADAGKVMLTIEAAEKMGATGADPTETERQLFEAWMKGHCWAVCGKWDGKQYVGTDAYDDLHPYVMHTRGLWAAWRDRAALAAPQPVKQEPVAIVDEIGLCLDGRPIFNAVGKVKVGQKLYAAPVRTKDLTDEEQLELARSSVGKSRHWLVAAVIAADREKNRG